MECMVSSRLNDMPLSIKLLRLGVTIAFWAWFTELAKSVGISLWFNFLISPVVYTSVYWAWSDKLFWRDKDDDTKA